MPEPLQFTAEPIERINDERRIRSWPSTCGRYKVIELKCFLESARYWLAACVLDSGGEFPIRLPDSESHTYRSRAAAEEACNIHLNPSQPQSRSESNMARKSKNSSTTKVTKQTKAKGEPKTKSSKPAGDSKKLSAIDAAAEILAKKKEPMTTKEMVEAMAAAGLWESPGGKTPHATLYSAILREISGKGKESRFVKTDRGRFAQAS